MLKHIRSENVRKVSQFRFKPLALPFSHTYTTCARSNLFEINIIMEKVVFRRPLSLALSLYLFQRLFNHQRVPRHSLPEGFPEFAPCSSVYRRGCPLLNIVRSSTRLKLHLLLLSPFKESHRANSPLTVHSCSC